eukprot:gene9822-20429_t
MWTMMMKLNNPFLINAAIVAITIIFMSLFIQPPKVWKSNPSYKIPRYSVFYENHFLAGIDAAYKDLPGAETIVIANKLKGIFGYTGSPDGWLLQLNLDGTHTPLIFIGGSPLGLAFDKKEKGIYACVPPIGLLYVDLFSLNILIISTMSDDGLPIRFPDDVKVASNGLIYFTDASIVTPEIDSIGRYDVMQASKIDVAMGSGTGRLLVYDPTSRKTRTLASGLYFANGLALSQDESYVCIAESFGFRVARYWLSGDKKGTLDIFSARLPGVVEGVTLASDGGFWVAIYTPVFDSLDTVLGMRWLGYVLSCVNAKYLPTPKSYGAVIKLGKDGLPRGTLQDPTGLSIGQVTSVVEKAGKIYLTSSKRTFIGVFDITKHSVKMS